MQEEQARKRKCERCNRRINVSNYELHLTRCKPKEPKPTRKEAREAKKRVEEAARAAQQEAPEQQPEEKFPCCNCGYEQSLAELDTHPRRCPNREATCTFCAQKYPLTIMRNHYEVCERRPQQAASSSSSPPTSNIPASRPNSEAQNSATLVVSNWASRRQPPRSIFSNQPDSTESRSESVSNLSSSLSHLDPNRPSPNRSESVDNSQRSVLARQRVHLIAESAVNASQIASRGHINIFTNSIQPAYSAINFSPMVGVGSQQPERGRMENQRNRVEALEIAARRLRANEEVNRLFLAQQVVNRTAQLAFQLAARQISKKEEGIPHNLIKLIPEKRYQLRGTDEEMCSICCTEFEQTDEVKDLKCKHEFHVKCISDWICRNKTCPLCKTDLSVNIRPAEKKTLPQPKKNQTFESLDSRLRAYLTSFEEEDTEFDE